VLLTGYRLPYRIDEEHESGFDTQQMKWDDLMGKIQFPHLPDATACGFDDDRSAYQSGINMLRCGKCIFMLPIGDLLAEGERNRDRAGMECHVGGVLLGFAGRGFTITDHRNAVVC